MYPLQKQACSSHSASLQLAHPGLLAPCWDMAHWRGHFAHWVGGRGSVTPKVEHLEFHFGGHLLQLAKIHIISHLPGQPACSVCSADRAPRKGRISLPKHNVTMSSLRPWATSFIQSHFAASLLATSLRQVAGICRGDAALLGRALDADVVVEPVRGRLIPGFRCALVTRRHLLGTSRALEPRAP